PSSCQVPKPRTGITPPSRSGRVGEAVMAPSCPVVCGCQPTARRSPLLEASADLSCRCDRRRAAPTRPLSERLSTGSLVGLLVHSELPVATVVASVPAVELVRLLEGERPSARVVALADALLAVPEVERRAQGWPVWVAADLLAVWGRLHAWLTARTDVAVVQV